MDKRRHPAPAWWACTSNTSVVLMAATIPVHWYQLQSGLRTTTTLCVCAVQNWTPQVSLLTRRQLSCNSCLRRWRACSCSLSTSRSAIAGHELMSKDVNPQHRTAAFVRGSWPLVPKMTLFAGGWGQQQSARQCGAACCCGCQKAAPAVQSWQRCCSFQVWHQGSPW